MQAITDLTKDLMQKFLVFFEFSDDGGYHLTQQLDFNMFKSS
jgi:hypothetical protein